MKMAPKVDPRPGSMPEQELLSPELVSPWEAATSMKMAQEVDPHSSKVPEQELLSPNLCSQWQESSVASLEKSVKVFRHDKYIVQRASPGDARGAGAALGRDHLGRGWDPPRGCGPALAMSFWLWEFSDELEFL